ncbi:MAG TPA: hypothetical protein VMF90_12295 [Rhizobiaceae bacterium]|nr:hypothetical protein [Rhizobiaceae bacterium]
MSKTFLPDYSSMSIGGDQHVPLFKLFAGEGWRYVRKNKAKVICASAREAIQAAKDHVAGIINPPLKSEIAPAPLPDVLGASTRHIDRAAREADGQIKALGGVIVKGRVVQVEKVSAS